MTIKILMSKLCPLASERARTVMVCNESIFKNISNQVEFFIMEITGDSEEQIIEVKKMFDTNFDIQDVFNQLGYVNSHRAETQTNSEYVNSMINVLYYLVISVFGRKVFK